MNKSFIYNIIATTILISNTLVASDESPVGPISPASPTRSIPKVDYYQNGIEWHSIKHNFRAPCLFVKKGQLKAANVNSDEDVGPTTEPVTPIEGIYIKKLRIKQKLKLFKFLAGKGDDKKKLFTEDGKPQFASLEEINISIAQLYEIGANKGYVNALWELGKMYRDLKLGLAKDASYIEAIKYFEAAAVKGHIKSIWEVGIMYLMLCQDIHNKQESDKNEDPLSRINYDIGYTKLSIKWFELAAKARIKKAYYQLGTIYSDVNCGIPAEESDKEAVKWFKLAAQEGDQESKAQLGILFLELRGEIQESSGEAQIIEWVNEYMNAIPADDIFCVAQIFGKYGKLSEKANKYMYKKCLKKAAAMGHVEAKALYDALKKSKAVKPVKVTKSVRWADEQ